MWVNKKDYERLLEDKKNALEVAENATSDYWDVYLELEKSKTLISDLKKSNETLFKINSSQNELIKHILNKTFAESEEFEYVMLRRKNEKPLLYKNGKEIGFNPKQITIQWSYDNPDGITVDLGEI